jgi:predicted ATP-grasp superfamily ATP-dependent carboligase
VLRAPSLEVPHLPLEINRALTEHGFITPAPNSPQRVAFPPARQFARHNDSKDSLIPVRTYTPSSYAPSADRTFDGQPGAIVLGGHAQGLGLVRSLGRHGVPVYLVDDTLANIARFSKYCTRFFFLSEMKQEPALLDFLTTLSKEEGLQEWVVFPSHDATVEILSKNKDQLCEFLRISTPRWATTEYAHNKILTYRLANKLGIPIPKTYFPKNVEELREVGSQVDFPVIIKPAVMYKFYERLKTKALKAKNIEELEQLYVERCFPIDPTELMVQEIIPGSPNNLYSCGCFYKHKAMKASLVGQRCRQIPMDFGTATTFAQSVDVPELVDYSNMLLSEIDYYGLAEVEFKQDPRDGIFKLLEINPRSWKWHTLAVKAGVDIPYLVYKDLVGKGCDQNLTCRVDVKWVELIPDLYVACGEIIRGNLRVRDYIESLKGEVEFAVASRDDPWPIVSYILLLPYFWVSR